MGVKPWLNKVKASGGCNRFYRAELDKIWAQVRQGAFDRALAPLITPSSLSQQFRY
ncbi:hypothetical protein [Siminovitchia terrae]|uniref:hypothetical protein n=1 Tax=Siminovitchia terrae TaxID=1914933 RepID=UPI001BB405E0|nr:hypothetical protein [Siminovitchia terrae]